MTDSNASENVVQIDKVPYPVPKMFEVKADSYQPIPISHKYDSPYYDQSSYCQRSGVKPFQIEKVDTDKINLTNRSTGEDDITQDLHNRNKAGGPEVEPYRARFLRANGHSGYAPSRSEVYLNPDLKRNEAYGINDAKNYVSTLQKAIKKERYPTYGFSDQHDIYSSGGRINETLNEELREPFKMFDKEYNIIDIIEVIIFIVLFVILIFILHDYVYCGQIKKDCRECDKWIPRFCKFFHLCK